MQAQQMKLKDLLDDIQAGKLVIPDFQRDFVWSTNQIEELLGSVLNRYFIGTLLFLESSTTNLRFAPRRVLGVHADPCAHSSIRYVLDGQQRITSLFYAFLEPDLPLPGEEARSKFYLKLPGCQEVVGVQMLDSLIRKLLPEPNARKLINTFRDIYKQSTGIDVERYPTVADVRSQETLDRYLAANPTLTTDAKNSLRELQSSLFAYEIPVVTLRSSTSDDEIVNTFERINRTGTRLDMFDLAVARYYPLGIRLTELKKKVEDSSSDKEILKLLGAEAILRTMAIAKGTEPKNKNLLTLVAVSQDQSEKSRVEFYSGWDQAVDGLRKALGRMRHEYGASNVRSGSGKRSLDLIPYTTLAVPLACMIKVVEGLGKAQKLWDKIDLWYWTTVFMQRYTHAVETQSFSDFNEMVKWLGNDASPMSVSCDVDNVVIEMEKAAGRSALAKAFVNLLILNGPRDFLSGQDVRAEACQVDHIFPISRFQNAARNVFNLTLITGETNRKKSDQLPAEFVKACLDSHGAEGSLVTTLRTHFISADAVQAMKDNNLSAFCLARKRTFIEGLRSRVLQRQVSPG